MSGSWFRGRGLHWDPDAQAIEQERQQWVYERLESVNELACVNPDQEYAVHKLAYIETGDEGQLRLMLEWVR